MVQGTPGSKVSGEGPAGTLKWNHTHTYLHTGGHQIMETPLHKVSVLSVMCSQKMLWFSAIDCCIEFISLKFCEIFTLVPAYLYLSKQANVKVLGF